MADTANDCKAKLHAEWLGVLAHATRGLRAKGVSVWLGGQLLCQLRFDRRLNTPDRHFLVGPLSNALLSWRLGEQGRAGIRGPRSVVELVSHLLSPVAEQELQAVLNPPAGELSLSLLRLLVGDALAEALRWMAEHEALAANQAERWRQVRTMLRQVAEVEILWPFLRQCSAQRLHALLLPLISSGLNGQTPEVWLRQATGRRDLLDRARHFPVEWIAAGAEAMPATAGTVRPYLSLWLSQLKRARKHLVVMDVPDRSCWVKAMASLCARMASLKSLAGMLAGEAVFLSLRLDATVDITRACRIPLAASAQASAIPVRLVHRVLLQATEALHQARSGADVLRFRTDLHRLLDWMGVAPGINLDMLGSASFPRLVDEARLWSLLLEDVQQWPCVLQQHHDVVLELNEGSRIRSLCSDAELTWAGMMLRNCLQEDEARRKYRRGCLRGVRRLFLLSARGGRALGALTLAWIEGGWSINELRGACNRELEPSLMAAVVRFVEHYRYLQPEPYPPVGMP